MQKYGIIYTLRLITGASNIDAAGALPYYTHGPVCRPVMSLSNLHSTIDRAVLRAQNEAEMIKQCLACGKDFRIKPSAAARRSCCNQACRNEYLKTAFLGANNPNYRGIAPRICTMCGKAFVDYGKRRKTCSRECAAKVPRKEKKPCQANFLDQCGFRWCTCIKCGKQFQFHTSSKKYCPKCKPAGIYYKRCKTCKKEFSTEYYDKKFCSRPCYNTEVSTRQKREGSHRWKGGLTRPEMLLRGSKEYKSWRSAVFTRDDYTCQLCFERGGKLAAHHIREYAKHPDLRLLIGNGITLCWPCHQSIKDKERMHETTFYDITGGIQ